MRLSLRFVIPLLVALAGFAYAALPLVDKLMLRWFSRDLEVRANLIARTVEDPMQDLIASGNRRRIQQFFTRITQEGRLLAIVESVGQNERDRHADLARRGALQRPR